MQWQQTRHLDSFFQCLLYEQESNLHQRWRSLYCWSLVGGFQVDCQTGQAFKNLTSEWDLKSMKSSSLQNAHGFWCSFPHIIFYLLPYVGIDKTFMTVKSLTVTWRSPPSCLHRLKGDGSCELRHHCSYWSLLFSCIKLNFFWSCWTCPHPVTAGITYTIEMASFHVNRVTLHLQYGGEPDKSRMYPSPCWQNQHRPAWISRLASAG